MLKPRKIKTTKQWVSSKVSIFFKEYFDKPENLTKSQFRDLSEEDQKSLLNKIINKYNFEKEYIKDFDLDKLKDNLVWYTLNYSMISIYPNNTSRIENNISKNFNISPEEYFQKAQVDYTSDDINEEKETCYFFKDNSLIKNKLSIEENIYRCSGCPFFGFCLCKKFRLYLRYIIRNKLKKNKNQLVRDISNLLSHYQEHDLFVEKIKDLKK